MEINDWVTSALAAVAVGISVWALVYAKMQGDAARESTRLMLEEASRNRVKWEFLPIGNDEYSLRNAGTEPAYGFKIDSGDISGAGTPEREVFTPGDVERYFFVKTLGTADDKVTITWHHGNHNEPETQQFLV